MSNIILIFLQIEDIEKNWRKKKGEAHRTIGMCLYI